MQRFVVVAVAVALGGLAGLGGTAAEAGAPPKVVVSGAGLEEPVGLDGDESIALVGLLNYYANPQRTVDAASGLEGRPRVELMLFYPWGHSCPDDFSLRRECAVEVIAFYPAWGGAVPLLGRRERVNEVAAPLLAELERLGVPVRIEAYAGLDSGTQALWVAGASMLGVMLAGGAGLALGRPRRAAR